MTVQELQEFANELIEVGKGDYIVVAGEGYSYVTEESIEVDDREKEITIYCEREKEMRKRWKREETQK